MVICIIRIHKKREQKRRSAFVPKKKRDMHAHIEVNTVQSVCVNKKEKKEKEKEKERKRKREKL
jgi:hypothetical protein